MHKGENFKKIRVADFSEPKFKALLFEIYSAGFESGYSNCTDIRNGFNIWYTLSLSEQRYRWKCICIRIAHGCVAEWKGSKGMRCRKARHTQTYWGSSSYLGREQSSSHTACTMRGSNPRRIHQSALLWESWRFLKIKLTLRGHCVSVATRGPWQQAETSRFASECSIHSGRTMPAIGRLPPME